MRSTLRSLTFLPALALAAAPASMLAACGGAAIGEPCTTDGDCGGALCLTDFAAGYCASDCTTAGCPAESACRVVGDRGACLRTCAGASDCRSGYMCWQGVCQPACETHEACGTGFYCDGGACAALPGAALGEACKKGDDCSSRRCDPGTHTCQRACASDGDCAAGETCFVNPADADGDGFTDTALPVCIRRRGGAAPGAACVKSSDCDRGSCQLGFCTSLCEVGGQCAAGAAGAAGGTTGMICDRLPLVLDRRAVDVRTCIFERGTVTWEMGAGAAGPIGLPAGAQGLNVYVAARNDDINFYTGLMSFTDPSGVDLYTPPSTVDEYFDLPLRYQPSEGTSMALAPISPKTRLGFGVWDFSTFAQTVQGQKTPFTTKVRIKLGPAPYTSGRIGLHVLATDLTGSCALDDATRSAFEEKIKAIFDPIHLTVAPIVWKTVDAPNRVKVSDTGTSPALDALLATAARGDDADVLQMVLVRAIDSAAGNGYMVLGIAGGIPGSTGIPGTPHSGAAIAWSPICFRRDAAARGAELATTGAHELAHTMGLFHNVEQDRHNSPLGDDVADGTANLMYWAEDNIAQTRISPNQAWILLNNPAVAP